MAKKNSGWIKWVFLLLLTGAAVGGGAWYWKKKQDAAAPQVQTATASRGEIQQVVTASGQLNPVVNVQVGSQISGRIESVYVDFNSEVKSNQIIAEIDPSTYQSAVLRAQAQMSNAVANLSLAKVQADRAARLHADNLIPAADFDTAMAQLQQAEAGVTTAQANLESAIVDLSRCTIVAPVDGVVISRNVDVGQTVAASFNTPTLFLIANDLSKMQIGALISEADIGSVAVGQSVNFTVDAYPYRVFRGELSQIRYGPITNQNVVNYNAIIDVSNEDLKLLPGMTANVSIITAERENALRVPNAALRFRPPDAGLTDTRAGSPAATSAGMARGGASGGPVAAAAGGMGQGGRRQGGGGGGRGPGGGGLGGGRRGGNPGADRAAVRTVYTLKTGASATKPEFEALTIRTGITDGIFTEVLDGLNEGDSIVTSLVVPNAPAVVQPQSNPFGGGRGGGGRGRF